MSAPRHVPNPPGQLPPSQEEAEARMHTEGYESFCWYDVPGSIYPDHRHPHDECIWVLRGEIQFTIGEHTYNLHPGDRLFLPGGTRHTARVPTTHGVTYLVGRKR